MRYLRASGQILRDARAIDGATVHVLTLVEIAGRRGYLAQIAPE